MRIKLAGLSPNLSPNLSRRPRGNPKAPPPGKRAKWRPRVALVSSLALAGLAATGSVTLDGRGEHGSAAGCPALVVTSAVQEDVFFNPALRAYADRHVSPAGWTGGDATYSARLPDGRTAWVFADSFLGTVAADRSRAPAEPLVHGAIVVQDAAPGPSGSLFTTTISGAAFLPDARPGHFWQPAAAIVDTVSDSQVLQVLVYLMAADDPVRQPYGYPVQTALATFSISPGALARTGFTALTPVTGGHEGSGARVTYGSHVIREAGHLYVYGHDWTVPARAYVARVPAGALATATAWRYWQGGPWTDAGSWSPSPDAARPMTGGVRIGYSVLKAGRTYVLFTMAPDRLTGLSRMDTYHGCSPAGPWRGPVPAYDARTDGRPRTSGTSYYNPHVHPEWTTGAGHLVSYDVNDTWPAVHSDVELYRPRFLRVRLG